MSFTRQALAVATMVVLLLAAAFLLWPRLPAPVPLPADAAAQAAKRKALDVWGLDQADAGMPLRAFAQRDVVTELVRDPGHCDTPVEREFEKPESREYRGRIVSVGPGDTVLVAASFTCGGLQIVLD